MMPGQLLERSKRSVFISSSRLGTSIIAVERLSHHVHLQHANHSLYLRCFDPLSNTHPSLIRLLEEERKRSLRGEGVQEGSRGVY